MGEAEAEAEMLTASVTFFFISRALFDFLMPGFLGVEKQFHLKYGKKIMAIRDPKASAKEREKGVLAMEALHRQVSGERKVQVDEAPW